MTDMPRGRIEMALRERLEQAGCRPVRAGDHPGTEVWFTPHLNREFTLPYPVVSPESANKVLFRAGLEPVFRRRDN